MSLGSASLINQSTLNLMNLLQSLLKMEKPSISQEITISTEKGKDRTTYSKKIYKPV
jgi:hypothetical protein